MMVFGDVLADGQVRHASTPVGRACAWCGESFVAGDAGYLIPFLGTEADSPQAVPQDQLGEQSGEHLSEWLDKDGLPRPDIATHYLPYHRECHIRQIVGSLAHQQGRCSCSGGHASHDSDPPSHGLTERQEAQAATQWFLATRFGGRLGGRA